MASANLIVIFIAIVILALFLIIRFNVNSLFVLTGALFLFGLLSGTALQDITTAFRSGFGSTAGYIGIVIAEGVMLAVIMERTGAMKSAATYVTAFIPKDKRPFAICGFALFLAFFIPPEAAFILSAPFVSHFSTRKIPSTLIFVILSVSIYLGYALLPFNQSVLNSASVLNAQVWRVFIIALISITFALFCGYLWIKFVLLKEDLPDFENLFTEEEYFTTNSVYPLEALLPPVITLLLMMLRGISLFSIKPFGTGDFFTFALFVGDPIFAFFIGIVCSLLLVKRIHFREALSKWLFEAMVRSSSIILFACAGGAFGTMVKNSSLMNYIVTLISGTQLSIFVPFVIAAVVKLLTGSFAIAVVTASSVVAPSLAILNIDPVLSVAAVGSGAFMVSFINDPFFWIVSGFSGMDEKYTLKIYSLLALIMGLASFAIVAIGSIFIG